MAKFGSGGRMKGMGTAFSGLVGARIAEEAGKSGAIGAAAGGLAARLVKRSPVAAIAVASAWLMHKLYQQKKAQEAQEDEARAMSAKPVKAAPSDNGTDN